MSNYATRLTVDLTNLKANYALFQKLVGDHCQVAGVVKANGYGTGADAAAYTLEEAGCKTFFVATLDEAIQLRKVTQKPIAVLGGLYKDAEAEYTVHGLLPVLNSAEEILRGTYQGPSIWHVDTGMNRLGLRHETIPDLLDEPGVTPPAIFMSHFACADEKDHPLNAKQANLFQKLGDQMRARVPGLRLSLANSSGIFRNKAWHHDLVRPGMALYGLNPTPEQSNPMRTVVTLEARMLEVKTAKSGETAGYSATHKFKRNTLIGIVGIGYADGFLRSGSNRASLYWHGYPCPVLGRVSMDLTILDLSQLPEHVRQPQAGDWLEVIGQTQSADQLADTCGTIGYEILTSLSRRAERVYTKS